MTPTDSARMIDTGLAEVRDDGSPRTALEAAAEFVRAAVHRSPVPLGGSDGWRYPSDVYDCVGELFTLTSRLAPLLGRLDGAVQSEQEARGLGVVYSSPYQGDPAALVRTASAALSAATAAAAQAALGDAVHATRRPRRPCTSSGTGSSRWATCSATPGSAPWTRTLRCRPTP